MVKLSKPGRAVHCHAIDTVFVSHFATIDHTSTRSKRAPVLSSEQGVPGSSVSVFHIYQPQDGITPRIWKWSIHEASLRAKLTTSTHTGQFRFQTVIEERISQRQAHANLLVLFLVSRATRAGVREQEVGLWRLCRLSHSHPVMGSAKSMG